MSNIATFFSTNFDFKTVSNKKRRFAFVTVCLYVIVGNMVYTKDDTLL